MVQQKRRGAPFEIGETEGWAGMEDDIVLEVVSVGTGGVCAFGVSIWYYGLGSGKFVASLRNVLAAERGYGRRTYLVI
jgi:hypothetical protein